MILAQIANADAIHIRDFLLILVGFVGLAGGVSGLVSNFRTQKRLITPNPLEITLADRFATRDELKELRDTIEKLRNEIQQVIGKNEERASRLHSRIDPFLETVARIDGKMDAFTLSFSQFTEVVKRCAVKSL